MSDKLEKKPVNYICKLKEKNY